MIPARPRDVHDVASALARRGRGVHQALARRWWGVRIRGRLREDRSSSVLLLGTVAGCLLVQEPVHGQQPEAEFRGSARVLEADRRRVGEGTLTRIYVRLHEPRGVANMDYRLRYDPAVVRPEGSPLAGNLLGGGAVFAADPTDPGVLAISFAGADGLDRDGTVAVVRFRAVAPPGARTNLTLETSVAEDAEGLTLDVTGVDGEIQIIAEETGGDPGGGRLPDCDGDGRFTSVEPDCALEMSVGKRPIGLAADVDGDGQVTSGDARVLIQRIRDSRRRP